MVRYFNLVVILFPIGISILRCNCYRCRHCTDFQPIWQELAEMINTKDSKFAIAEVDCTVHHKLCHENDITGN